MREAEQPAPVSRIISFVVLTFLAYAMIGLPLAVVPGFVHNTLGYGSVVTGLSVSIQYLATVLSRSQVGQMCDLRGPKLTVLRGFTASVISGVLLILAAAAGRHHGLSLGLLLASRLALGVGESFISTGAITWGINQVGARETARVISWNGVATYGALAVAAPIGVWVAGWTGFAGLGVCLMLLSLAGFAIALPKPPTATMPQDRLGFAAVLGRVILPGAILALASTAFGSVATFITLFYGSHGWAGAATALSAFGLAFMTIRLTLAHLIGRFGSIRVALVSLVVETGGLLVLWQAGAPGMALLGTVLAGCGFSLIFPALGVEAVGSVPPQNRGAALGVYSVFLDISLGLTGPVTGLFANHFSLATPFLVAAVASACGFALTWGLRARRLPGLS